MIAQTDSLFVQNLEQLLENSDFQQVIQLTEKKEELSLEVEYLRACALLYNERVDEALAGFNRIIEQDSLSRGSRYYKSYIHFSRGELQPALATIDKALQIAPDDPDFHTLRGEISVANGEYATAASAFEKALSKEDCSEEVYSFLAETYLEMGDVDKALTTYQEGIKVIPEDSERYENVHFNAGLLAYLIDEFVVAKEIYAKLYKTHSSPNIASKLIQAHYALEEYEAGDALKADIYEAWRNEALGEDMKSDFCFDQFKWNGQRILVFERFEEPSGLHYKHVFYLSNEEGKTTQTLQTEWSPALEMSDHGMKYVLGRDVYSSETGQKLAHYSYFGHLFKEEVDYKKLKETVIAALKEEISPSSSTRYGGENSIIQVPEKSKKRKRKKKKKKTKRT